MTDLAAQTRPTSQDGQPPGEPAPDDGVREMPRYVEVETSRRCNRACAWCPNGEHTVRRQQELMDWGLFTGLLAELRGLGFTGWLAFHNYNEPLLNPRLGEELEAVASILPEARPTIFTNGDVLTVAMLDGLIRAGVRQVRVTLYPRHAGTAPSDERIRGWLARAGVTGMPWRWQSVRQGRAAVCERSGCRVEVISPDIDGTYNTRGGSVRSLPLTVVTRTEPCLMTATSASIDYRGRLKMCCCVYPEPGVGHDRYVLGSLTEATFAELWWSEQMARYRTAHAAADWSLSPACIGCRQPLPETRA